MSVLEWAGVRASGAAVALLFCAASATTRAQTPRLTLTPDSHQHSIFVAPGTLVGVHEPVVFVKDTMRVLTLRVSSRTPFTDTARLMTEAKKIVAAESGMAQVLRVNAITVLFEHAGTEIPVPGVSRPDAWPIAFVRGKHGWEPQRLPAKKVKLEVRPGKP